MKKRALLCSSIFFAALAWTEIPFANSSPNIQSQAKEVSCELTSVEPQEGCTLFEGKVNSYGCGAGTTELVVNVTNNCSKNVEVKICSEKKDTSSGRWSCSELDIRAGSKKNDWYCGSTGNYKHWVRAAGSTVPFPEP